MYLRMRLNKWDNMEVTIGRINVPVKVGQSIGYMEVYESLDDLKKDYPREDAFMQIEEVEKKWNVTRLFL